MLWLALLKIVASLKLGLEVSPVDCQWACTMSNKQILAICVRVMSSQRCLCPNLQPVHMLPYLPKTLCKYGQVKDLDLGILS